MLGHRPLVAVAVATMVVATFAPPQAHAQNGGAILGGILGGVVAGAIIANARPRPVVVYGRRHDVRAPPRARVARVRAPARPHATPQGAAVISASADPFSKTQGPAVTTPVSGRP